MKRDCIKYPLQVNFTKNDFTHFAVYNTEKFKNKFGDNIDECITKNELLEVDELQVAKFVNIQRDNNKTAIKLN